MQKIHPHNTIISATEIGYKITNEDFVPPNFVIESMENDTKKTIVQAYNYDCPNYKILKHYKMQLKIK